MANGTTRRVLVIDDDEAVRMLLVELLTREGFEVVCASNGKDGIASTAANTPDLVISDVQMPGASGYEVCRRIRERFGDVPFIFLSGTRTEPYDRVAGFAFGADDYITKPFDPDELVARVRALIRRAERPASAPSVTSFAAPLTAREREVLQLMADGLSQAEIGHRLVISPSTVGKHIERILRKLRVRSRVEAVALAYRDGVVTPDTRRSGDGDG